MDTASKRKLLVTTVILVGGFILVGVFGPPQTPSASIDPAKVTGRDCQHLYSRFEDDVYESLSWSNSFDFYDRFNTCRAQKIVLTFLGTVEREDRNEAYDAHLGEFEELVREAELVDVKKGRK